MNFLKTLIRLPSLNQICNECYFYILKKALTSYTNSRHKSGLLYRAEWLCGRPLLPFLCSSNFPVHKQQFQTHLKRLHLIVSL